MLIKNLKYYIYNVIIKIFFILYNRFLIKNLGLVLFFIFFKLNVIEVGNIYRNIFEYC